MGPTGLEGSFLNSFMFSLCPSLMIGLLQAVTQLFTFAMTMLEKCSPHRVFLLVQCPCDTSLHQPMRFFPETDVT